MIKQDKKKCNLKILPLCSYPDRLVVVVVVCAGGIVAEDKCGYHSGLFGLHPSNDILIDLIFADHFPPSVSIKSVTLCTQHKMMELERLLGVCRRGCEGGKVLVGKTTNSIVIVWNVLLFWGSNERYGPWGFAE